MYEFSKEVNKYLGKELITTDNETKFLCDFRLAFYEQVSLDETMLETGSRYEATVNVWNENIEVSYDVVKDDEDLIFEDLEVNNYESECD